MKPPDLSQIHRQWAHTQIANPKRTTFASGLYTAAWAAALAITSPYLAARSIWHRREMAERFARWPNSAASTNSIWIHASSMGETKGVLPLVRSLKSLSASPVLSVVTPTAYGLASDALAAGASAVHFAPFDFRPLIRKTLSCQRPTALLICETEIWPALLRETLLRKIPVAFINARLTERSVRRLSPLRPWLSSLLHGVHVAAQTAGDAERWSQLGVSETRLRVTGNTKYELSAPPLRAEEREAQRGQWKRIIVFGSIRSDEIASLTSAVEQLTRLGPETLLVLVPRHLGLSGRLLKRLSGSVSEIYERSEPSTQLLPPLKEAQTQGGSISGKAALLMVRTMGELARYYAIADAGFVGGTFGKCGGHNLLEPASVGVPVFFGPDVKNVEEISAALISSGGGFQSHSGTEMGSEIARLLGQSDELRETARVAQQTALELSGAVPRTLSALAEWSFPIPAPIEEKLY